MARQSSVEKQSAKCRKQNAFSSAFGFKLGFHLGAIDVFGIKRTVETDIGTEKYCLSCKEYWPADTEFFEFHPSSKDRLSQRCIACIKARNWGKHISLGRNPAVM
jgi:hypothetical protein